jgi:subtilisin family serine protease
MSEQQFKPEPARRTAGSRWTRLRAAAPLALLASLATIGPASAQLLPGVGGLRLPSPSVGGLTGPVLGDVSEVQRLADQRLDRLREQVLRNPKALDLDGNGAPVVRGEVLALSPTQASIDIATAAGFTVQSREQMEGLGLEVVILRAPAGLTTRKAVERLKALDPAGRYDFDHLYGGAGAVQPGEPGGAPIGPAPGAKAVIGLVDTGVAADHPAFAHTPIRQEGFAPGGVHAAAHGTAVASLMAGDGPGYRGAAPGAQVFAADVYGTGPTGGSVDAIVRGLAWLGRNGVPVINMSLVGPPNVTLEAAIHALTARGVLIVAPVGNDGPAAPPLYPASYPEVIAVTAVDPRRRQIPEAGRASHLDFAAPGAGVPAARPGGGFSAVRGTSFAAPIVAGELAMLVAGPARGQPAKAIAVLAAAADTHGGSGLGRGVIGEDVAARLRSPGRSN